MRSISRYLALLLVAFSPTLITLLLISAHLHARLDNFLPSPWNDQTWLYRQVGSFSQVGFNSGYYTAYEHAAPASFTHFSAWGPVFPMLYGSIARFTGWQPYTSILFNMVVLGAGSALGLYLLRFDWRQIALAGLVLLALGPVLMFMPTASQESFHQAAAFGVAFIFYKLFNRSTPLGRTFALGSVAYLIFISLIRFSWALFLPPFFILLDNYQGRRLVLSVAKGGVLAALVYAVVTFISAPGSSVVFNQISSLAGSGSGLKYFIGVTVANLNAFTRSQDISAPNASSTQVLQFALLGFGAVISGQVSRKAHLKSATSEWLFHAYNLGSLLLLGLAFYAASGYYRVFAPHMLIMLLLLIAQQHHLLVYGVIGIAVIMIGGFLNDFRDEREPNFVHSNDYTETSLRTISEAMPYNPDAANPYCNTVLISVQFLDARTLAAQPGIGVSFYVYPEGLSSPLHSAYLWLNGTSFNELKTTLETLNVEPIVATNMGTIYRNLDADCPD